jgi:PAS domain S-box-containing protein
MKFGFRTKMYVGVISLLLVFGIGIFFVVSRIMREALLEENRHRGISVTTNLAARVGEPILAMDFLRMKNLVDETVQLSDDIFYAFIVDRKGKTLVHTFKGGFPVELKTANAVEDTQNYSRAILDTGSAVVHDYAVPVLIGEQRFGTARIGLVQTGMQRAVNRLLWTTFLSTGLVIALAGLMGTFLARTVTRKINMLHGSSEAVMRGNLDIQTAPLLKKNCWEIMKCDKEDCPAYGEPRLRCWYLAGTLCPQCVEGEYAKKIANCRQCPVYKRCAGDEMQSLAESFDTMARTLKTHITDLRTAEATLTEQRELLKTILDSTPDLVSLQDRDSMYRASNKAFCQFVGKREDEIIGGTDFDLFSPEQAETNRQEDLSVLQSGNPLVKNRKINGSAGTRWFHVVKTPVRDSEGEVAGLLCSWRDITEFKRVQEQLTQAQKMEAVGQLTAGIAHEINTPLGIVVGYAQLLAEDLEPGSQMEQDLKTIEKHGKICKKIVADLLRFSRHTESSLAPVSVNDTIEEVVSMVAHTYSLERVFVERRYDPALPPIVGDEEKLRQAFVNLLNNAFDAIGTDGVITVSSSFDPEVNEVVISLVDTGSGIPEENLDKIFDPFFSTKGVGKGTGLGLSVTFGIIKDHGGRIQVQSPPSPSLWRELGGQSDVGSGKGTVFRIHLPVDPTAGITQGDPGDGEHSHTG